MDALIGLSGFGLVIIGVPIAIIILILKILNKNVTKKDKFRPFILLVAGIVLFFVGLLLSSNDSIIITENAIVNEENTNLNSENKNSDELSDGDNSLADLVLSALFIWFLIFWFIYENQYYKSESFKQIKNSVIAYVNDCNELNIHINELKDTYVGYNQLNYGKSNYYDNSKYRYKRKELAKLKYAPNVYNCSRQVCDSSRKQPYKYICKYFGIKPNEESLEMFEQILNNFEAANNGKDALINEKNRILNSIYNETPALIRALSKKRLERELGFKAIKLNETYYPKYIFQYVSSGGNASLKNEIVLDISELNGFIKYLSEVITFRKSAAGQRALMTSALRKKILERDGYTCQICGASVKKEPNLLLEIDHIFPVSKGGLTTEGNLRTLCWKCNRKKGNKIEIEGETEPINNVKEDEPKVSNIVEDIPRRIINPHILQDVRPKMDITNCNKDTDIEKKDTFFMDEIEEQEESFIEETAPKNEDGKNDFIASSGKEKDMYDASKGIYPPGEYLIGEDIETGKYLLTSCGDYGGIVTFYESYRAYMKDENMKVIEFDKEYHLSLRENGIFIVVEYAEMKKL